LKTQDINILLKTLKKVWHMSKRRDIDYLGDIEEAIKYDIVWQVREDLPRIAPQIREIMNKEANKQ